MKVFSNMDCDIFLILFHMKGGEKNLVRFEGIVWMLNFESLDHILARVLDTKELLHVLILKKKLHVLTSS